VRKIELHAEREQNDMRRKTLGELQVVHKCVRSALFNKGEKLLAPELILLLQDIKRK
jgi:hypothetical protein